MLAFLVVFYVFLIQDSFAKMEIFREAIKIINNKFPLDSEFEIYERKMKCSITKKKWKEAYIRYPANPDNYSKAYSHAGSPAESSNNSSDEDSDSEYEWMAKYELLICYKKKPFGSKAFNGKFSKFSVNTPFYEKFCNYFYYLPNSICAETDISHFCICLRVFGKSNF